jgi:F-type H+-transporting ATPase subunit gamma
LAKGMRDIKRQIKSVQNMKQITKAMEMVAASKLKRSEKAATASRPYSDKIKEVIASIAAGGNNKHPMLQSREVKRTAYLVITSDRGLAGGYNANVLRKVLAAIKDNHTSPDEYAILVIGRKGRDFFRRRNIAIAEEITGVPDAPNFADIKSIASAGVRGFEKGIYDELNLAYNEYKNAMTQEPVIKRILPLSQDEFTGATADYEYEPSAEEVLDVLLPKYAETLVFSAMLESKASEFGARMTAMGSATKNATKMIDKFTLAYNRARQAAITQEIAEIVGGVNAQQ